MHVHIDTYVSICFRFYVTTFMMLIILMLKNPVRFFVIWRLLLIEDNFCPVRFMTFLEPSWVNMNIFLEKILLHEVDYDCNGNIGFLHYFAVIQFWIQCNHQRHFCIIKISQSIAVPYLNTEFIDGTLYVQISEALAENTWTTVAVIPAMYLGWQLPGIA